MKKIIFSILLLCMVTVSSVSAGTSNSGSDYFYGGAAEYPNEGYMTSSASAWFYAGSGGATGLSPNMYDTMGHNINYTYKTSYTISCSYTGYDYFMAQGYLIGSSTSQSTGAGVMYSPQTGTISGTIKGVHVSSTDYASQTTVYSAYGYGDYAKTSATTRITISYHDMYNISGAVDDCIENVTLYHDTTVIDYQETTGNIYLFEDIIEEYTYKLVFSNGHEYEFFLTGDVIYDYYGCTYMNIYLKDYCGNMMTNTSCDIYKSDGGNMETYEFVGTYFRQNPVQILVNVDVEEGKMLDIYFDTDMGDYHQIEYCIEQSVSLLHPTKSWSLSLGAFDETTHAPIPEMRCVANQTCKIDHEHPLKQFLFTGADGYGTFIGVSAQPIDIYMGNPAYFGSKFFVDPFGDAFHTHCSLDTYFNATSTEIVDGDNQTDNVSQGCAIWFKDQTGKRDRHINDTDTYVDLYYENTNCTSTLKFQRLYASYWMTKQSWNIPINETGHKRIYNTDFSVADANYRAILYADECECNCTLSLYVSNQTIEEEQHYQNLSAHCRFKHQIGGGQVDYRSPVDISAYAYTNCSHTLLNINLTLYETGSVIASKQCDWADFAGATPKWLYVWSPNVEYDIGKNYTVIMSGYNGLNLDADDVWTSNIRNNALTVRVRDNHNTPIAYSSVFVQGWGSEALGSQTSLTIEGFQDQSYQYKATKSGYVSSGWATANFSGEDLTVTCVLTQSATESVTGYKLKDDEIKSFFIPLMYMLFIMILLGGLMNAVKP